MNLESKPQPLDIEKQIENTITQLLSKYPETIFLGEIFIKELDNLKTKIKEIENGILKYENAQEVEFEPFGKNIFINNSKDNKKDKTKTTIGELISGLEWQKKFNLKKESFTKKEIGKKNYNQYIIALTEYEILALLDKHILEREIEKNNKADLLKKQAYEEIQKRQSETILENKQLGVIAEKMIQSLLTRISIDRPDLNFEIKKANAYQDVEEKIDFTVIIKRTKTENKEKGVKVESTKDIKNIQFTIKSDTSIKEGQLIKHRNVILVQMPGFEIGEAFNKWQDHKNNTISPDKLLGTDMERKIIEKILE